MAGGNNIATYSGGFTQHLYLAGNAYYHAYGNDRETMTFDDAGSVYMGQAVQIKNRTLQTPGGNFSVIGGPKQNSKNNDGKMVVVVNGTGAGQYRRVLNWSWSTDPAVPSQWLLDRPFEITPDSNALFEISTFRGNCIFHHNHHEDSGAHQLYGVGVSNLIVGVTGTRMGGFISGGGAGGHAYHRDGIPEGGLSFVLQPNLFNMWIGVEVLEGLRADHRQESLSNGNFSGIEFGDKLSGLADSNAFSVLAQNPQGGYEILHEDVAHNRFQVWKRCVSHSNAGFFIADGADQLLEHNTVRDFSLDFSVANVTLGHHIPWTSSYPFAVANLTSAFEWDCCGAQDTVLRGNVWEQ